MARPTFEELRERRLNTMSANERAEFDGALAVARLAMEVGEKVRDAARSRGADTARPCRSHVDEPGGGCPPRGRKHERHAHNPRTRPQQPST